MIDALEEIKSSPLQRNIVALIERHRDWHRDLGTYGIGVTYGLPHEHPQRAYHREYERLLGLLVDALRGDTQ